MRKKKKKKRPDTKALAGINPDTKEQLKKTATYLGKEILLGTVLGAAAGAAVGRSSLLAGALITGIGHYHGNTGVSMFGAGMMASGGYQTGQSLLSGSQTPQEPIDGIKERLSSFKEGFLKRLWLDKLAKKRTKKGKAVNGPDVQYFSYPGTDQAVGELDMSGLDRIEEELSASAEQYSSQSLVSGEDEPIY